MRTGTGDTFGITSMSIQLRERRAGTGRHPSAARHSSPAGAPSKSAGKLVPRRIQVVLRSCAVVVVSGRFRPPAFGASAAVSARAHLGDAAKRGLACSAIQLRAASAAAALPADETLGWGRAAPCSPAEIGQALLALRSSLRSWERSPSRLATVLGRVLCVAFSSPFPARGGWSSWAPVLPLLHLPRFPALSAAVALGGG